MKNITFKKLSDSFSIGIHNHTPIEVSQALETYFAKHCEALVDKGSFDVVVDYPDRNLFCVALLCHSTKIAYNFDCMMTSEGVSGWRHSISDFVVANH